MSSKGKNYFDIPHISLYLALALILLGQLFFMSNIPLHPDEAYYIDWTNYLDFGYVEHPPLFILILFIVKSIFGKSIFALRMVSFISYVMMIVGFVLLMGRERLFFTLTHISMFFLIYSFTLVTEPLFYALGVFTLYLYWMAFTRNQLRFYLLAGGTLALASLTNLMGLFIGLSVVWSSFFFRKDVNFKYLIASIAIAGILYTPYLYWIYMNHDILFNHLKDLVSEKTSWELTLELLLVDIIFAPLAFTFGIYYFIKILLSLINKKETLSITNQRHFLVIMGVPVLIYYIYKTLTAKLEFYWLAPAVIMLTFFSIHYFSDISSTLWKKRMRLLLPIFFFIMSTVFFNVLFYGVYSKSSWVYSSVGPTRDYQYFDMFKSSAFQKYYDEKMDKTLPIVTRGYQIPCIINFYMDVKEPARILSSEFYHKTIYSLNYYDEDTIRNGMYYVVWKYNEDIRELQSLYDKVREIKADEILDGQEKTWEKDFNIIELRDFKKDKEQELKQFLIRNRSIMKK